jgi:hypothetical protein
MDRKIELEALVTEREGMIAENTFRVSCGNSIAYGADSFTVIADKLHALAQQPDEIAVEKTITLEGGITVHCGSSPLSGYRVKSVERSAGAIFLIDECPESEDWVVAGPQGQEWILRIAKGGFELSRVKMDSAHQITWLEPIA